MKIIAYALLFANQATSAFADDNQQNIRGLSIFSPPAPKDCDADPPEPKDPWTCGSTSGEIEPPVSNPNCAPAKLLGAKCETETIPIDLNKGTTRCGMMGSNFQETKGTTENGGIEVEVVTNWPTKGDKITAGYTYEKSESTCQGHAFQDYNVNAKPNNHNGKKKCGTCISFFRQVLGCAEVWEYEQYVGSEWRNAGDGDKFPILVPAPPCGKKQKTLKCGDEDQTSNICNRDCN